MHIKRFSVRAVRGRSTVCVPRGLRGRWAAEFISAMRQPKLGCTSAMSIIIKALWPCIRNSRFLIIIWNGGRRWRCCTEQNPDPQPSLRPEKRAVAPKAWWRKPISACFSRCPLLQHLERVQASKIFPCDPCARRYCRRAAPHRLRAGIQKLATIGVCIHN